MQECHKRKKSAKCPWLSKGILNACKKKNNLYRKFIKLRTKEAENCYKVYKNKLTNIIRASNKKYYTDKLEENKNSMKGIWGILKDLLKTDRRKTHIQISLPSIMQITQIFRM